MTLLANIVRTAAALAVAIIVVAILLVVLGANPSNGIVQTFHDAGSWLVGPFKGLFSLSDHKVGIAVNWGIAAIVYGIVGGLLVRLLAGAGTLRFGRRTTAI
ncbi:MAG: hypothetical protein QOJ35_741 [Solirubrobacteraceae bacterium]|nr:hypothetical protein [Solirubrobacteraceae bacterium]